MATGSNIRKTTLDKVSIEPLAFDGLLKKENDNLYILNSVLGDQVYQIDTSNISVTSQSWKSYTVNPVNPVFNPYQIVNSEDIKKDGTLWLIRILLNGIELDTDEFTIAPNKRTITLNLPNGLTIDNADELKIWYVKE